MRGKPQEGPPLFRHLSSEVQGRETSSVEEAQSAGSAGSSELGAAEQRARLKLGVSITEGPNLHQAKGHCSILHQIRDLRQGTVHGSHGLGGRTAQVSITPDLDFVTQSDSWLEHCRSRCRVRGILGSCGARFSQGPPVEAEAKRTRHDDEP